MGYYRLIAYHFSTFSSLLTILFLVITLRAMKRSIVSFIVILFFVTSAFANDEIITIHIKNPLPTERKDVPVVIPIPTGYTSALITINGEEIPCQLDDLNDDGINDELAFVTNLKKKEKQVVTVILSSDKETRKYASRTYGYLALRDRSTKTPKHLPIRTITVPKESNSYQYIYPHGPILESELVGFRIYADHRQSVDYYGHRNKQLELEKTAFYPTKEQKSTTYGDDVLFTGDTYGCGTLHGWDGTKSVMFDDVRDRRYTVLATGPVRTIIETTNRSWRITPVATPVDITTRYILYAGHRDVMVDVRFSRNVTDLKFSTGVVDIVGSEEYTDKNGIRACWGTALAGKNTEVYDIHTVGLAVYVPEEYYHSDAYFTDGKDTLPSQAYVAVLGTKEDSLHYWFAATCDIETFGYAGSKEWFSWLKVWKNELTHPVEISIDTQKFERNK